MLDLGERFGGNVADVGRVAPPRFTMVDTKNLGVTTGVVGHPHHADRSHVDPAAREGGILGEHEDVEGITVLGEGLGDEPVLGRVGRGGEQAPVEPDAAGLVIDLVLVAASSGYLDHDVDGFHTLILPVLGVL